MMPFKLENQPYYFPFIYFKRSTIHCKHHFCSSKKIEPIYKDFLGKWWMRRDHRYTQLKTPKPLNPAYKNHVSGIKEKV